MGDVTVQQHFSWDPARAPLPQILEIVRKIQSLPPTARVREVIVLVEYPAPTLTRG